MLAVFSGNFQIWSLEFPIVSRLAVKGAIEMAIDEAATNTVAKALEHKIQSHDYVGLHNLMLNQASAYDKDSFNNILTVFAKINSEDAKTNKLPTVEIHNDGGFFGFGATTEQVILKGMDDSGKKMEIYETPQHRDAEVEESRKQAEPLHIDLFHNRDKAAANEWVGSKPDFNTDSSVPWDESGINTPLNTTVDHRNGNVSGAYDNGGVRINSEQDLQYILNHPPKGYR